MVLRGWALGPHVTLQLGETGKVWSHLDGPKPTELKPSGDRRSRESAGELTEGTAHKMDNEPQLGYILSLFLKEATMWGGGNKAKNADRSEAYLILRLSSIPPKSMTTRNLRIGSY